MAYKQIRTGYNQVALDYIAEYLCSCVEIQSAISSVKCVPNQATYYSFLIIFSYFRI